MRKPSEATERDVQLEELTGVSATFTPRSDPVLDQAIAQLDRFDISILNLVQDDNQQGTHVIGEKVGLSPSAVQRRLRRLRETGIIASDISRLSPAVSGKRVTLIVEVSLEREQLHQLEEFQRNIRALPSVVQCYYVTGRADFVLILNMASMEAYGEFTKEVFFANRNVKQFYTAVVMEQVKFTTRVPLDVAPKAVRAE